jgi:hypothetical protein
MEGPENPRKDTKMDNDSITESTTKQETKYPRGLRCFERWDRPSKPYLVQRTIDGRRETESYSTQEDRDRRARQWAESSRANLRGFEPTRSELIEFRAFKEALGGDDWRDIIAYWRSRGNKGTSIAVEDSVAKYLESQDAKVIAGKLEHGSRKRHVKIAERFGSDFKGRRVATLTTDDITDWLEDQEYDSPHTFNSYLRIVRAIWSAAKITPSLPKDVSFRDTTPEEVAILTVDETRQLFSYGLAHLPWLMPRLAAEAFVGLRYSSAVRLEPSDINVADRGILLPAKKIKTGKRTGRRHYIDGLPDNFWEWMTLATDRTWDLTERQYMKKKSDLFVAAGVPHPKNCLRHSACTYHVAAFKDPGKTATMLCHTDQQLLWSTYNGRASQGDGRRYFAITPDSLRTVAASQPSEKPSDPKST